MSRKEKTWRLGSDFGRDSGKAFHITEFPPRKTERWCAKLILQLIKAGVDVPEGALRGGLAGMIAASSTIFKSLGSVSPEIAFDLMDEMLECVEWADSKNPAIKRPLDVDRDIEELATLVELRGEVIGLHVGFSVIAKFRDFQEQAIRLAAEDTSTTSILVPQSEL